MSLLAPLHRLASRFHLAVFSWALRRHYAALYEAQARQMPGDEAIGNGPYEVFGRFELEILQRAGLKANHTLLDFGCGDGRLAIHAIPYLSAGNYFGIDISPTFLERARNRAASRTPKPACRVRWQRQIGDCIPLPDRSVDMMCAYSVFTHMEHEDAYRYLRDARRVVRRGGRVVFSCLPMTQRAAHEIFVQQAALDFATRWRIVRNVTTSVEMMDQIAGLAGWRVVEWFAGDRLFSTIPGEESRPFGQSVCVLESPG